MENILGIHQLTIETVYSAAYMCLPKQLSRTSLSITLNFITMQTQLTLLERKNNDSNRYMCADHAVICVTIRKQRFDDSGSHVSMTNVYSVYVRTTPPENFSLEVSC